MHVSFTLNQTLASKLPLLLHLYTLQFSFSNFVFEIYTQISVDRRNVLFLLNYVNTVEHKTLTLTERLKFFKYFFNMTRRKDNKTKYDETSIYSSIDI